MSTHNSMSGYAPHYSRARSNLEYGCTPMQNNPSMVESSFDSRLPHVGTPNHSNVQVLCRINASKQASQAAQSLAKVVSKRPASATRILFQPMASNSAKGAKQEGGSLSSRSNQLKINSSRSFMSVQSTPAIRSPSLEQSRSTKRHDSFVPLRNKYCKPVNGVRFPSAGSPSPVGGTHENRRKPLNQSTLSFQSQQAPSKHSQLRPSVKGSMQMQGSNALRQDSKHCVFTTTRERSNKVVVCETPISTRIINEQLTGSAHLDTFMQTCNANGYDASVFDFDNVFSESVRQDKFYAQAVKPAVQAFVEGENASVVFFGPSQSGKTYSLHGKAGKERGVVPRAVEDVLSIVKNTYEIDQNLNGSSVIEDFGTDTQPILSVNAGNHKFGIPKAIMQNSHIQVYNTGEGGRDHDATVGTNERMFIKMSVYMIYCDRVYDLLAIKSAKKVKQEHYIDPASQQVVAKFTNMTEKLVLNLEQYYSIIQDAYKERKTISVKLTDHEIRKRSHFVISMGLVSQGADSQVRELSRLNFTELCGSEQSVAQGAQSRDTTVRQFVTKSFNGLSTQILKSALNKRSQLEEGDAGLVNCLKHTLTSKSNVLLIACANPSPQNFDHALPAVKFCARIRDTIVRKLQKQGFAASARNQLEESEQRPATAIKQTRFNLEVEKQTSGPMSTFGRVSAHSDRQESEAALPVPSLKKPHMRKHSRSSSPIMSMEDIQGTCKQLDGEVIMYDALTREYANGNKEAIDLDEVREWSMRSLESINKALFSLQKKRYESYQPEKRLREDLINSLFYLKERITAVEKAAMTANPFRSVSPENRAPDAITVGTTSAASMRRERDNPFNQVTNMAASKSEYTPIGVRGTAVDSVSAVSSATRIKKAEEPSYFSGLKQEREGASEYRTFDHRRDESGDRHITRSDLSKKVPFQSQYGRELSARLEHEQQTPISQTVPQSARDGNNGSSSLRDFSKSPKHRRNGSEARLASPKFISEGQHISKKQSLVNSIQRSSASRSPRKDSTQKAVPIQLLSARDQPELQLIQDKFLSSQRVQHIVRSTFGDQAAPKSLYNSAEETLADIQRLIMLDDFDGLRRRVVQLFKERRGCDDLLQTKDIEIEELREQLNQRDDAVREIERLNERNLDEYLRTLTETKQDKDKMETQTSLHMRNLQETIDEQMAQLNEIKGQRTHEEEKYEQMTQQFDLNNRLRQEAENKASRLEEENQKLYTNYDVLKEHELNIIKDFQDKRVEEQSRLDQQIEDLRRQIDVKNEEINSSKKQITDLESELRKQEFETQRVHEQKTLQSDAQGIIQSKLDREKRDGDALRDKITRLENDLERARNEARQESTDKKLAFQEIKQLQELISEMEKTIQRLGEDLRLAKSLTEDRQGQIAELDTQKRVYEERLVLKDKEMQAYIDSKQELVEQLAKLQGDYNVLDEKHVKLRAQEYDKVDVLRVNAELEGRTKNLQIDVENLIRERNALQDKTKEGEESLAASEEKARQLASELDYYRKTHEMSMDKFEKKFTEFSTELHELTDQNQQAKDKEKKLKRYINQLEVRNLELEERHKYAQQRNQDLNAQVEFVGRDMQKLAKETGEQVQVQMRTAEQTRRREDATERAFTDIKSMISQFRNERNHSKERVLSRGRSASKLSPSPRSHISPDMLASMRQNSNSPQRHHLVGQSDQTHENSEWQRRKMSPLRQF